MQLVGLRWRASVVLGVVLQAWVLSPSCLPTVARLDLLQLPTVPRDDRLYAVLRKVIVEVQ